MRGRSSSSLTPHPCLHPSPGTPALARPGRKTLRADGTGRDTGGCETGTRVSDWAADQEVHRPEGVRVLGLEALPAIQVERLSRIRESGLERGSNLRRH